MFSADENCSAHCLLFTALSMRSVQSGLTRSESQYNISYVSEFLVVSNGALPHLATIRAVLAPSLSVSLRDIQHDSSPVQSAESFSSQ